MGQVLTRWDELKGEKLPDTSQFAPTEGSVCGVLQILLGIEYVEDVDNAKMAQLLKPADLDGSEHER
jgi:hypothetical protein